MIDFKQLDEARKLFGLGNSATLKEIKNGYRKLSLKYHPDKCTDEKKKECERIFKKITEAYDILMNYCADYRFSFEEKNIKKEFPQNFYNGWF